MRCMIALATLSGTNPPFLATWLMDYIYACTATPCLVTIPPLKLLQGATLRYFAKQLELACSGINYTYIKELPNQGSCCHRTYLGEVSA